MTPTHITIRNERNSPRLVTAKAYAVDSHGRIEWMPYFTGIIRADEEAVFDKRHGFRIVITDTTAQ